MGLDLDPGQTFEITATGERGACLEIEYTDEALVVWYSELVRVTLDGELVYLCDTPFPSLPSGMTIRDFFSLVGLDKVRA